jgi:hypothetical protein
MRHYAISGAVVSLVLLAAEPATGQNPQTTAPQNPTVPVPPRNSPTTPPERIAPAEGSGNLSEKLSRDRGMVKPPPSVDPGMTVAPPRNGSTGMPVIPPPGSPGGNQSVVPK